MPVKAKQETKETAETIREMFKAFGASISEVLETPEVRVKATELAESVVDAVVKVSQSKVKDAEVRARVRDVGKAAKTLGSTLEKHFKNKTEAD
jgi:predicted secreted protein